MVRWSDIHYNLEADAQGNIRIDTDIDAIKTSIVNILRTPKGSRVMRPNFGSRIADIAFENMSNDLANMIAKEVKTSIEIWDPRISIANVDVFQSPDENKLSVNVGFTVKGYDDIFTQAVALN